MFAAHRWKLCVQGLFALLWFVATAGPIAAMHLWHSVPLPQAPVAATIENGDAVDSETPSWRVFHILIADCPCSGQLGSWLQQRSVSNDSSLQEPALTTVVLVNADETAAAMWQARGFLTQIMTEEDVWQRWQMAGGPWLLIENDNRLVYRGGYAPRRPSNAMMLEDQIIVERLRNGESVNTYAAFGCTFEPEHRQNDGTLAAQIRRNQ